MQFRESRDETTGYLNSVTILKEILPLPRRGENDKLMFVLINIHRWNINHLMVDFQP